MVSSVHNRPPLKDQIFLDPAVTIHDVTTALADHIEQIAHKRIALTSQVASLLAENKSRLPDEFDEDAVRKALDLLNRMENHSEEVVLLRDEVLGAPLQMIDRLKNLCEPLDAGLPALEKALRPKIECALTKLLGEHNRQLVDGEAKTSSLTIRSSSGAKATVTESEELEVADFDKIPREFLALDAKKVAAALKEGKEVPGTRKKIKTSLRLSCKSV